MADETEQTAMQDLFRVINEMRSETNAGLAGLRSEMNTRFNEAAAERQAKREEIDQLASQDDFDSLDRKISAVSADTQATRHAMNNIKAEVSRLRADVKTAGIPGR